MAGGVAVGFPIISYKEVTTMSLFDLFKPVPSISPDEVREYIKKNLPGNFCLLDVRQPAEYEQGHLPGARLVPLHELPSRIGELDPEKTTIVYCRSGNRSRSAAGLLMSAGIKKVLNMEGGILRYNGIVASGPPEAGMFCFPETLTPEQLAAVAWFLEDGTIRFLEHIRENIRSNGSPAIIKELLEAKNAHKVTLEKLYTELTKESPSVDFPRDVLDVPAEEVMVGCIKVSEALQWSRGKTLTDVMELLITLGANSYDLYLKLGRTVKSEEAGRIFNLLAEEEERNINHISSAFEKTL
jgi:rhodanese-related sulfurtransferase